MRTETITYNIYSFDELSKDIQKKVIDKYRTDEWNIQNRSDIFYEDCLSYLKELFPNSKLNLQYSLSYCQGDGLEVYGNISFLDLLHFTISEFSEKEIKTLNYYFKSIVRDSITLDCNRNYTYYHHKPSDFYDPIVDDLEWENIRDINYKTISKFSRASDKKLKELCFSMEKAGYDALYYISDEDIVEEINANEYEFLADGKIW